MEGVGELLKGPIALWLTQPKFSVGHGRSPSMDPGIYMNHFFTLDLNPLHYQLFRYKPTQYRRYNIPKVLGWLISKYASVSKQYEMTLRKLHYTINDSIISPCRNV